VGFADSHTWGSTSSCVDCHENDGAYTYLSDYGGANGHQVMDHDGLTGTTSATEIYDCNNCHAAATKVQIAGTTHTACSNCHNSSGGLIGARPNGTTVGHVVGSTSNCADCHGAYAGDFETHIYANSTTDHVDPSSSGSTVFQLAGTDEMVGTACDACHGATLTDWANVYALHNVSTNGAGACATCHNSTSDDTDDGGTVQTVIHDNNQSTNPCISCHVSKASDHADHVLAGWVTGNDECTGCHDQGGAADEDQYLKVIHGDGATSDCTMCHTNPGSSDYTLLAGSSAQGHETGPNTCNTCHNGANGHPDYAADFASHLVQNHAKVGGIVTCTDCHSGDIVNLDANPDVHADNCQDCHNNITTDGRLHAGDVAGSVQNASHGVRLHFITSARRVTVLTVMPPGTPTLQQDTSRKTMTAWSLHQPARAVTAARLMVPLWYPMPLSIMTTVRPVILLIPVQTAVCLTAPVVDHHTVRPSLVMQAVTVGVRPVHVQTVMKMAVRLPT
jgi:hypothetical protein